MFPEFPEFCLNLMFFLRNNYVSFYLLCLLGLYITRNVVQLMFIAYFSLMSLTMMVFSACVNDMFITFYMCYYLKAARDGL